MSEHTIKDDGVSHVLVDIPAMGMITLSVGSYADIDDYEIGSAYLSQNEVKHLIDVLTEAIA